MVLKVLLVDVDGVIIHGRPTDGLPWWHALHQDLGIDIADLGEKFFEPHWHDIVCGRSKLRQKLKPVLDGIAPKVTCDTFIKYWFENDSRVDHKLLSELAALRTHGIKLHLATNQESERADFLWHQLKLNESFDAIHYSGDIGSMKPQRLFFEAIRNRLDTSQSQLMLIDDQEANVAGAIAAGWRAAIWRSSSNLGAMLGEKG